MKKQIKSNNAWMLQLYATAHQCLAAESVEPLRSVFKDREAWAKIHSRAKDKGKAYREAFARYDRGERPSVFAEDGNGKLPFVAFSSLAGLDCPQAGACLYRGGDLSAGVMSGFCYSFKAWRYPDAFMRQLYNSIRLRTEEGRQEIIAAWMDLPRGVTVRLYVDGDFASPQILAFWMRLCNARPDLQVYGYSKSWALLLSYDQATGGRWPSNYLLNLSSGGSGTDAEKKRRSQSSPLHAGNLSRSQPWRTMAMLTSHGATRDFRTMRGTLGRKRDAESSYALESAGIARQAVTHAAQRNFVVCQLQSASTDNKTKYTEKKMKTYIVYDETGKEVEMIKAGSHNAAEKKAQKKHGEKASVAYTEI